MLCAGSGEHSSNRHFKKWVLSSYQGTVHTRLCLQFKKKKERKWLKNDWSNYWIEMVERERAWIHINIMKTNFLNTVQEEKEMVSKKVFVFWTKRRIIRLMAVNLHSLLFIINILLIFFGSHIIGTRYHNDWDHAIINIEKKNAQDTGPLSSPDKTLIQWIEWFKKQKNKKQIGVQFNQKNGVNYLSHNNFLNFHFAGCRNGIII